MSGSSHFLSEIGKRFSIGHHYFTIEKVIAEGGFGVVFLVRNGYGNKLALKRLYVNEEVKLHDSKTEIEILSRLAGYKNVIKYIDSSVNRLNNGVYEVLILTEYYPVTCVQLQEQKGVFSESEVLRIFCDMCEALTILHDCQEPIIHRDMKLENILMDNNHNFVLCDFGSATREYTGAASHSHLKSVRQLEEDFNKHTTPSHRAPEITDFYSKQIISEKIDIWALGVTLFRLCFNHLPFGDSTLAIQSGQFVIPEGSRYSEALHSLIYYCLEVDPNARPDIHQVSAIAFKLCGRQSLATNKIRVNAPTSEQLIEAMRRRQAHQTVARAPSPRPTVDRSEWVETTTVRPRERPKPGKHLQPPSLVAPSTAHPDISSHLSNPQVRKHSADFSRQQLIQPAQSGSVPTANMLDFMNPTPTMTRSLDNPSPGLMFPNSDSPFGDDFSKLDPSAILSSVGASSTPSGLNIQSLDFPKTAGFEDSFSDLLITSNLSASQNKLFSENASLKVNQDAMRGHRRYKSDGAHIAAASAARQHGEAVHSVSDAPVAQHSTHLIDISQAPSASANHLGGPSASSPFGDDFSTFTSNQLASQTNHRQNNHASAPQGISSQSNYMVDEFGCAPFNPTTIDTNAKQTHWSYSSDRNFLPGFS